LSTEVLKKKQALFFFTISCGRAPGHHKRLAGKIWAGGPESGRGFSASGSAPAPGHAGQKETPENADSPGSCLLARNNKCCPVYWYHIIASPAGNCKGILAYLSEPGGNLSCKVLGLGGLLEAWLLSGAALPFLGSGFWPEPLGPNASEDGLRLSVTWEIFDFPTQRIRAARLLGRRGRLLLNGSGYGRQALPLFGLSGAASMGKTLGLRPKPHQGAALDPGMGSPSGTALSLNSAAGPP